MTDTPIIDPAPRADRRTNHRSLREIADDLHKITRSSIFERGDLLLEAKAGHPGEFLTWLADEDYSEDTAERWMNVARLGQRFRNLRNLKLAKTTFYALCDDVEDEELPPVIERLAKESKETRLRHAEAERFIHIEQGRLKYGDRPDATLAALVEYFAEDVLDAIKRANPDTEEAVEKIVNECLAAANAKHAAERAAAEKAAADAKRAAEKAAADKKAAAEKEKAAAAKAAADDKDDGKDDDQRELLLNEKGIKAAEKILEDLTDRFNIGEVTFILSVALGTFLTKVERDDHRDDLREKAIAIITQISRSDDDPDPAPPDNDDPKPPKPEPKSPKVPAWKAWEWRTAHRANFFGGGSDEWRERNYPNGVPFRVQDEELEANKNARQDREQPKQEPTTEAAPTATDNDVDASTSAEARKAGYANEQAEP